MLITILIIKNDELKILPISQFVINSLLKWLIVLLIVILMVINNKLKILPMELFQIPIENRKD